MKKLIGEKLLLSIIAYLILQLIVSTISLNNWYFDAGCDALIKTTKDIHIKGIVKKKFLNETNHLEKTLIVDSDEIQSTVILETDRSGLYEYAQPGDSLIKKRTL